jgi:hypothetical protein
MTLITRAPAALALALAAACGGRPAETAAPAPQAESAAFVTTLGNDTLTVERYTRTATTLTGELVARSPRVTQRTYTARLRPDGGVESVEVTTRVLNAPPSAPATVSTVRFAGDTADVRSVRGDSVQTLRVPGTLPLVAGSYAFYEQALMHTRRADTADAKVRFVAPGNPRPVEMEFRALGGDSVRLSNIAGPQTLRTDAGGRLLGLSGLQSTQKFEVARRTSVDVGALGAEYARREAAGQGLGALSPRDTAEATLSGARIAIDYGRPLKRGRTVLGQVVPLDSVWRTGANAATILRTDRDLVIGGTPVPAGSYSLFTLPTREGWKLIVNRQTGQWGTEYRPEQDLARIDLRMRTGLPVTEQFTIRVDPDGTLRMLWDDWEVSAPVEVR